MKLIKKLVTGLMILLVALGSSPLEVFALPNNGFTEWPTGGTNDVTSTLPQPPAAVDIVDLKQMFNYPILDYSGLHGKPDSRWKEIWRPWELNVIKSLKGYVPVNDSSVAVITRDAPWQAGVMWSQESNKINLAEKFHMISYVYLGSRGQADKFVDGNKRAGADGITFTIHNDKKDETILDDNERNVLAGNKDNHGMNAYGALGNGLGVYGSNFSANTASPSNNTADMRQGVTNGIALEFDTFYNHNNTTQHSDNDLWKFVGKEGDPNSNFGHIGINYLNDLQYNRANEDTLTGTSKQFSKDTYSDTTMIKHRDMLSVGWNGNVTGFSPAEGWQAQVTGETQKLADGKWHRLEVTWEPNTTTKTTGKLTYKIYRQGYNGPPRQLTSITPIEEYDGNSTIDKVVEIDVKKVFDVDNIYNSVYWGFTGSTGYYQNNQAVQMLQLPVNYYTAELSKVDQDGKPVSGARFKIEKKNETTGEWDVQKFYNLDPETPDPVVTLETGTQDQEGIYDGVSQSLGKITLKKLTYGKYRWTEISAPDGYEKKVTYYPSREFDVNYQNQTVTTTAVNKRLYQLELTKTDSDTKLPLNDVPFIISKTVKTENENDKQYYLKLNAETTTGFEWTEVEAEAEHFLSGKSYALDETGKISGQDGDAGKLIVKYFPDAPNLSWKEVSVPAGYDSSGPLTGDFTPSTDGYVYSATQTNSPLYQVSLKKTESDYPNAALRGAVFSLQKMGDDKNWKTVSQDEKSEFTTNSEGKITISNLKAGTYRWEEKQAPVGYKIKQQYYQFEVTRDSVTTDSDGNLATDPDTNNYIIKPTIVENDRKFELVLQKLSSTFNRPIGEVEFTLYSNFNGTTFSDSDKISARKTNSEGEIDFGNDLINADKTAEKTYYLVETKPAKGFIALNGYFKVVTSKTGGIDVSYVSYKSDGETDASPPEFTRKANNIYSGHLKIYNKRRESILPTTGGNGILGYVGIGLTMTIVALLFFIARKRIFKWLIILIVATSGLAGLAGGTQVVSAQEQEQVQLELNRLVYQPSDRQYKSGVPVAGAKLEVVDVTKSFYELVNRQKLSLKEAQEAVSKSNKIDGQSLAVATTDQSGLVRFTVSKTSQQRPAVYLIRELVTPVAVTKMENMVVVLPILDESGNEKSLISLFPKSQGTFTFDKTIDEKQSSYSFGEPIPYRLSTIIPQDMMNLSSYEIEDIYDQGLRFISESLEIFIDGEKQSDSIKAVNLSENQFRVVFDVAKLADFGGKKLEVTYQMVIKDESTIDQDLVNTATLYPGDLTPLVDKENIQTGGFRFIKRAAEGKQNPLAKATFVIKNPTDDTVLTYKEGKYQFEKVATNASGVVRLTSDDDGYFEIKGLRYGEYLVSEIRAPSGYVLQDKPTAFTVGVSTYSQGPVLSIFNVKKPKIRLPETGTVATSTAFVGLLIMASSLVMIRRRKDN
ncbi:SpaH/EbpB family LPXTG-anchored major pilin [Streptococcus suis]|uniref:SpaH/EbpB family LPXTG-anchored major pilin n=1 Tax=Streptococcus parasuis TaxID=1501662 RepID=UPI002377FDC1|nr:SpaH/EbpB family LPXTG-anchored major pilin [Streptococcus parasuis]MDG3180375.1 SpaH/EbpB family LPXTG-anchored major pilin [Streptococcus suis]WDM37198.1 SpaH/EbpB family LPXTG-anchored major pilin [Streptococcus parasuis]